MAPPLPANKIGASTLISEAGGSDQRLHAIGIAGGGSPEAVVQHTESGRVGISGTFRALAELGLEHLATIVPMGLWMFTRVNGEHWIVLATSGDGYGITPGTVLRWSDSICSRMVKGQGPNITGDVHQVPQYLDAPVTSALDIRRYCGFPVTLADGTLFGTVCGIDPAPMEMSSTCESIVAHVAQTLTLALRLDLERDRLQRERDLAQVASQTDALTGLGNRRAFTLRLEHEEARADRYGATAGVVIVDLDGLKQINDVHGHHKGDATLVEAARALRSATRPSDGLFRIGGDEFAIVVSDFEGSQRDDLERRLQRDLVAAGVDASIGIAVQGPGQLMIDVVRVADALMYAVKHG